MKIIQARQARHAQTNVQTYGGEDYCIHKQKPACVIYHGAGDYSCLSVCSCALSLSCGLYKLR